LIIRETGFLNVLADFSFSEKELVINPNDGFDLGLMQTEATVLLFVGGGPDVFDDTNAESIPARVVQKNECRLGTVEMSLKHSKTLDNARKVRLHLAESEPYPKLLIYPG